MYLHIVGPALSHDVAVCVPVQVVVQVHPFTSLHAKSDELKLHGEASPSHAIDTVFHEHPVCRPHENESSCDAQLSATPSQLPLDEQPSAVMHVVPSRSEHGVGDPTHWGTPEPGPPFSHQPLLEHCVPCGQLPSSRHFETQMCAPMHIV